VKAELVNDECGYLAEISKQHVGGMACRDLLLLIEKCEKKEINSKEELLHKKEAGPDNWAVLYLSH